MTLLDALVRTDSAKALGWALLHSLWEGAAISLVLAIALAIARSSRVRYAAACLAMFGLLAGFAVTLYVLAPREISHAKVVRMLPLPVNPAVGDPPAANHRTPWDASELPPWLAPIWLAGVFLFQLRCLISWTAAGRLRRTGVCGASNEWIERLDGLRTRLRMTRPVTLLESCFAEVPVVIGHLRPVILMPVGLLAGLPVAQVEAILLHELAHIRRADYLVNLMQTLVEGLLFYHPAAWWISSAIRTERENCCDDLVVSTSGDAHEYATALAALAENRWTMRETALAATGGNLVKRIRRLLSQPEGPRSTIAPVLSVGILVVTGAVALAAWEKPAPQLQIPAAPYRPVPLVVAQPQTAPAVAESPYDKWLKEEVAYIITDRERADFKKLQTDADRQHFVEEFWKRRDPTPGTPENEYRDEHYRRIAYANDRFHDTKLPGWKTDRGRIYIEYGPPDEIDSHPAGGAYTRPAEEGGAQTVTYPFEMWKYRYIDGIGNNVILEFVDKGRTGEYRLTMDPKEKEVAQHPLEREQAELSEKLEPVEQLRALDNQMESADLQGALLKSQAQMEQTQKELEQVQENVRSLDERLSSELAQNDMVNVQSQSDTPGLTGRTSGLPIELWEGFSAPSITTNSRSPFADSSLNPSCSWISVKIDGPTGGSEAVGCGKAGSAPGPRRAFKPAVVSSTANVPAHFGAGLRLI
jgi:GWxTD domain-containing protein